MTAQAAPAAGLQGRGAEHAGNNTEERGHGLPAAGGIEGKQVGPGGTDRAWGLTLSGTKTHVKILF